MLIMARDRTYGDLLNSIRGKKVAIWTCNTCARLCNETGGTASMERLATALANDGINVLETGATSAGCMESKLRRNDTFGSDADIIIALTCDIGAVCAEHIFNKDVLNPVRTYGYGYLTEDGIPMLMDGTDVKNISELTGFEDKEDFPFI